MRFAAFCLLRSAAVAAAVGLLFFAAGCQHAPDGRQLMWQSETALDSVHSFRAHIETGVGRVTMGGPITTDAEYDCDRFISHYVVRKEQLHSRVEYIRTKSTIFSRELENGPAPWHLVPNTVGGGPCERLHSGQSPRFADNLFSAEDADILPPFSYFASKPDPPRIAQTGKEPIAGVDCEIWKVDQGPGFQLHTIWLGVEDRLPRKYVAGELTDPLGTVTFSDYGQHFDFEVPPET